MPQVDLDSFVSVCGGGADRKISCETLAEVAGAPPDMPPESFWLSKDEGMEWYDRHVFLERKESTKGNSNSMNLNPNIHSSGVGSNNSSQRFSANLKSRPSILGLPKPQKTCFADVNIRRTCRLPKTSLFLGRSRRELKPAASMAEPTSPKVSCIGKVRSKTDRSRRNRADNTHNRNDNHAERCRSTWKSFLRIFRSRNDRSAEAAATTQVTMQQLEHVVSVDASTAGGVTTAEPPCLGAAKRLTSGRRPGLEMMVAIEQSPEEMTCSRAMTEPPLLGGVKRYSSGRKA